MTVLIHTLIHISKTLGLFIYWLLCLPARMSKEKNQTRPSSGLDSDAPAMQAFCDANAKAWQISKLQQSASKEKVLIEGFVEHKAYLMANLVIGSYLMRLHGLPGAALLNRPDSGIEAMFRSYGITEFHYLVDSDTSLLGWLRAGVRTFRMVAACPDIGDLLEYDWKGVHVGMSVYDWYLRGHGAGTINGYFPLLFSMLSTAFIYSEYFDRLFSAGEFPALVLSEQQFVPGGTILHSALAHGVKVHTRGGGPTSMTILRYDDPKQFLLNKHRYGKKLFDHVWTQFRDQAVEAGGRFLQDRLAGKARKNDIPDAALAYATGKEMDRETLCAMFGWDQEKPIVIIMSNMLNDGVFTNRWAIFRDNFTWLDQTVKAAAGIDTVNWLVKAHPSDIKNKVKITGRDIYEKHAAHCPHVQFFPDELDSRSLPGIVDVVLTAHGSAGLEYSSLGIPCVLGGESLYSGLGFTHEPLDADAYFAALRSLHELTPLSQEQIAKAKTFAYIYLMLSRVESLILPDVSVYADYDEDRYLRDAAELLQKHDPLTEKFGKMMRIQAEGEYRHMLNYDWIGLGPSEGNISVPHRQELQESKCM